MTTSSIHHLDHNRFRGSDFVEEQVNPDDDYSGQLEKNDESWIWDYLKEEYMESFVLSGARRKIMETWMDGCIREECPGFGVLGELDVWRRRRGVDGVLEEVDEDEEELWDMLANA